MEDIYFYYPHAHNLKMPVSQISPSDMAQKWEEVVLVWRGINNFQFEGKDRTHQLTLQ